MITRKDLQNGIENSKDQNDRRSPIQEVKMEQLNMEKGNYEIKAIPTGNKAWKDADDINIVLSLQLDNEERIFKGIITLTGVIKNGNTR